MSYKWGQNLSNMNITNSPNMNSTKEIQERTEPHKEEAPIDDRLVSAEELLDIIWTPTSRPSLRWLREQQALRTIPFTKVAGRVWFSPHQVRECLAQDWTLRRRAFRPRLKTSPL